LKTLYYAVVVAITLLIDHRAYFLAFHAEHYLADGAVPLCTVPF
jgi:hypothetical protein